MKLSEYTKGIVSGAEALNNSQRTVNFINEVEKETAGKVIVTSTVRNAAHNAAVNGQPNSKHLNTRALAVDFRKDESIKEIIKAVAIKHDFWFLEHNAGSGTHYHCEYKSAEKKTAKITPTQTKRKITQKK